MRRSRRQPKPAPPTMRERVGAYVALTKPRIIELLLVTTVPAMVLAARGIPPLDLVFWTLIGGTMAAGAANAINCYIDRDIDLLMTRTRRRPLPAHEVDPENALVFGLVLGVLAFGVMAFFTNLVAAFLTLIAMAFYVVVYTMLLKRSTPQNIVLGGAAGALPPVIGWAAVTGDISLPALLLFAIVFYWTPPHFWALSLRLRRDYAAASVPMLPVTHGVPETTRHIALYTVLMVCLTLVFFAVARMGLVFLAGALVLGALFLFQAIRCGARAPTRARCGCTLLDHVPDRAVRAGHPRRLRLLRDLNHIEHQQLIDELLDYDDPAGSARSRFVDRCVVRPEPTRSILHDPGRQGARAAEALRRGLGRARLARRHRSRAGCPHRLLERGRVLNTSGRRDRGSASVRVGVRRCAQAAGFEHLAVDALHMVAIVAPAAEQDGLNRRALPLASEASDPRAREWRASLLNNIGWTAFERGDYTDAWRSSTTRSLPGWSRARWQRSRSRGGASAGRCARWAATEEALEIQRALAEEHRLAGTSDPYVDEEIEALTQTRTTPEPGSG